MNTLCLSSLGHTWFIDLDGTIVKHNGYLLDGHDTLLPGALNFLKSIPENDMVIIVTSRTDDSKSLTLNFLSENGIRYSHIIFNAPYGERVLVNDEKPSGLCCSRAVSLKRDTFDIEVEIDSTL